MVKIYEITFELTNYCPHYCNFCSSRVIHVREFAYYLSYDRILEILGTNYYDRINLSGGEPLAHPKFYDIFNLCKKFAKDVVVYSNLITHRRYNAQVIDGVYLEADVTVTPETDAIHVLRRVKQGKEKDRPEVHLSRNHFEDCSCDHEVVRPNGEIAKTPCNKWSYKDE